MRINEGEQRAIAEVIDAGHRYGFGNMISHLQTAWAKVLMEKIEEKQLQLIYEALREYHGAMSGGTHRALGAADDFVKRVEEITGKRWQK